MLSLTLSDVFSSTALPQRKCEAIHNCPIEKNHPNTVRTVGTYSIRQSVVSKLLNHQSDYSILSRRDGQSDSSLSVGHSNSHSDSHSNPNKVAEADIPLNATSSMKNNCMYYNEITKRISKMKSQTASFPKHFRHISIEPTAVGF